MKKNSGIAHLLLVAIIAVGFITFLYFSNHNKNTEVNIVNSPTPTSDTNTLVGWKSFTTQFGLSFKYPDTWSVFTFPENKNLVIVASAEYAANIKKSISTNETEYIRISYDECMNRESNKTEPCNSLTSSIQNVKYDLDSKSITEKEIMIDNKSGTQIEGLMKAEMPTTAGKYRKTTIFPVNNYQIRAEIDNRETVSNYENIISTFHFVN